MGSRKRNLMRYYPKLWLQSEIDSMILLMSLQQKSRQTKWFWKYACRELHNLRSHSTYRSSAFVEVRSIRCVIGRYPEKLIKLWKMYDDDKTSDNDCPSIFGEHQLYIALELCHGGEDLEAFVFQTAEEAYALFLQVLLILNLMWSVVFQSSYLVTHSSRFKVLIFLDCVGISGRRKSNRIWTQRLALGQYINIKN